MAEQNPLKKVYSLADGTWTADFSADGWRLPTLPEWEYAARGGAKSRGFLYSGGNDVNEVGWFDGNSGGMSHAVGQKKPNELGLYDMSGNVGERCWDCGYTGENPAHVGRGGCWMYYEGFCEPEYRFITTERWKAEGLGLRLFRSANEQCGTTERLAKMIATETGADVAGGDRR